MISVKDYLTELNIEVSDKQAELFEIYYELLIFRNSKINLTSITDKEDVIIKHFVDSITLLQYIDVSDKYLLDVGTGAGFPGIPLKIMCSSCNIVLLDSLNKRVDFLKELIARLNLTGIETVCGRAEDYGHDDRFREKFDIVTSRAVAGLNTLSEYCLPFVNPDGIFVSYKSGNIDDEASASDTALTKLNGRIDKIERFTVPGSDYERSFVFIIKTGDTPNVYPRRAGTPSKKPL